MYKVILFSHEYPPCLGGVGTIASQIFNHFKSHDLFTINVITSIRTSSLKKTRVKTSNLSHKLWFFSYYYEFMKEFKDADVIICNDPAAIYIAGKYFSDDLLKKTVCLIHGEEKYLNRDSIFCHLIGFRKSFYRTLYNAQKIIFVSSYIEQFYSKNYGVDLVSINSSVINPGVFSEVPSDQSDLIKKENSFITVCRLHKKKGFEHMIKVFENLSLQGLDFEWSIVGGGEYSEELTNLVAQSSVKHSIKVVGPVDRSALANLYGANNYCILLSEFNESYGLSYLEAAHFGAKPIGYNRCGVTDVFKYIKKGLLLDNYLEVDSNANQIYSFVKTASILPASSSRNSVDFIKDLVLIVLDITKEKAQ